MIKKNRAPSLRSKESKESRSQAHENHPVYTGSKCFNGLVIAKNNGSMDTMGHHGTPTSWNILSQFDAR
jgi:hypothetical protein